MSGQTIGRSLSPLKISFLFLSIYIFVAILKAYTKFQAMKNILFLIYTLLFLIEKYIVHILKEHNINKVITIFFLFI